MTKLVDAIFRPARLGLVVLLLVLGGCGPGTGGTGTGPGPIPIPGLGGLTGSSADTQIVAVWQGSACDVECMAVSLSQDAARIVLQAGSLRFSVAAPDWVRSEGLLVATGTIETGTALGPMTQPGRLTLESAVPGLVNGQVVATLRDGNADRVLGPVILSPAGPAATASAPACMPR